MKKINERTKNHDKDIERLCNFFYQGFIDSIRELLQVRTQAQKLNVSIEAIVVLILLFHWSRGCRN